MVPRISMGVANELICEYDFDNAWTENEVYYNSVCMRLNLTPTNNIMFAIGGEEYNEYKREGYNRICLSQEIDNEKTGGAT